MNAELTAQSQAARPSMRTFLIICISQAVSILGSGMTSFALGVYIFSVTRQATPFAITVLFASLPRVLLAPLAGAVADRFDRRKVMILADSGDALSILAIALLAFSGNLQIWMIYAAVFVSALCNSFQSPAYSASVIMLVPKEQLGRANGLIQLSQSLEMLVSPVLAGILFPLIGLSGVILVNIVTFSVAVGALFFVRIPMPERTQAAAPGFASILKDAAYGWNYLSARPGLFGMLWYFALVNFLLGISTVILSPMVLSTGSAATLGALQTAGGVGMLVGSLIISAWGGPKNRILGVLTFIGVGALGLAVMGFSPNPWITGAGLLLFMTVIPMASTSSQGIFQTRVPRDVQGRVFAIRGMISQSIMPLAFIAAGPLADRIAEPLMQPGGALAVTRLGAWLGTGAGRGMGLIYVTAGTLLLIVTLLVAGIPHIRNVEKDLPDVTEPAA